MVSLLENGKKLYFEAGRKGLELEPEMTISEWADQYRMIGTEGASEPGKWRTDRTPYLREIMNCLSPSHDCKKVVLQKGSQIGGTEIINNWIGYVIHQAPGPFLMVQPTQDLAKKISKQRLATAIKETDVLSERIAPPRERDSGNTLMTKEFPGGVLMLTGANSAAGLRSMPVRYLALDEVDAYPADIDEEGDPVKIAEKRTATFARKKIFILSTPTIKYFSRIEREFLKSDQRYFNVPCPHCKTFQRIRWEMIKFEHKEYQLIGDVTLCCEECGTLIEERYKTQMLEHGKWISENENGEFPGFHLSGLYSPLGWTSWTDIVLDFLEFKRTRDINLHKAWKNTALGESWETIGKEVEYSGLFNRREEMDEQKIDKRIALITAGVDIQDDRIEVSTIGWGRNEESFLLDYESFYGELTQPLVWKNLDTFLLKNYLHENGIMNISCTSIDTGGHFTNEVYEFAKAREIRRIYAIKGANVKGLPICGRPSRQKSGVYLFHIGVDTAKEMLYNRLLINEQGAGYIHFPKKLSEEYFRQLTAEKLETRYKRGRPIQEWVKKRERNEALDLFIYGISALYIFAFLVYPNLTVNQMLETISEQIQGIAVHQASQIQKTEQRPAKKRSRMINTGLILDDL